MHKAVIVIVMIILSINHASADVTVGEGGDFMNIAEALAVPATGTLVIRLINPLYTESGLVITKNVEIIGMGPDKTIIQAAPLPGTASDRVFTVTETGHAVFRDLTIQNGKPTAVPYRGGAIDNEGWVSLEGCRLSGNEAVYGGALFTRGYAQLKRCSINGNYTTQPPNEILNTGIGCKGSGGALKTEKGGELILDGCSIWNNYAHRRGGGVFIACESTARITNTTIAQNDCRREGGGIYSKGDLYLNHVTIADNSSFKRGSGLYTMGKVFMEGTLIAGNSFQDVVTGDGSGIYGRGFFQLNQGNFVADGSLEGAAAGDPKLKKLKGIGETPPFMPLGLFSPARNGFSTATTPAFDQAGRKRGKRPDIGAVENRF